MDRDGLESLRALNLLGPLRERFHGDATGDEAWVAAAQRGSRPAFDALARSHESRLRGFLVRQVGREAAADVLQETWIAAWAGLPRLTRRLGFKAWLYGIALHKCRDHQRRQARDQAALAALQEAERPQTPSWDEAVTQRTVIHALLDRLPAAQREVLELYYYAELSLPEIAALLARNQNTVKYQFYRAHAQVAQGLNADGMGE